MTSREAQQRYLKSDEGRRKTRLANARWAKANPEKKRKVITRRYHQRHPDRRLLLEARKRAKRYGMRLNITIEDCAIPKICPVLGLPLRRGASGKVWAGSPTLDRIDSRKGYVKGNVIVVSKKANTIKSDATIAELQAVLNFYRTIGAP